MNNWINVNDELPEQFTEVLMFDIIRGKRELGYYVDNIKVFFKTKEVKGNFFKISHWLPLPENPKVASPSKAPATA